MLADLTPSLRAVAKALSDLVDNDNGVFGTFNRLKIKVLADGIEQTAEQLEAIGAQN